MRCASALAHRLDRLAGKKLSARYKRLLATSRACCMPTRWTCSVSRFQYRKEVTQPCASHSRRN